MAWPTVTAGQAILASQFNALSGAISLWQGNVNSNGYALTLTVPLAIASGGTGQSTAATAVGALGALAAANNLSDLTDTAAARSNLGITTGGGGTSTSFTVMVNGTVLVTTLGNFFLKVNGAPLASYS